MKRTLTIIEGDDGYFCTFDGERVADKLQDDEALGVVAKWLMQKGPMRYSCPIEHYWDTEKRLREEIESKLRPVDRLLLMERRDTPMERAKAKSA